MSLSKIGAQGNDTKPSTLRKYKRLNPNAAAFVPFALRTASSSSGSTDAAANSKFATSGNLGKTVLDRAESSISNNSDEEARQYWSRQLPDDITPDFKVVDEEESHGLGVLSLEGLSLHDGNEAMRFSPGKSGGPGGYVLSDQQNLLPHQINGNRFHEKLRLPTPSYEESLASPRFLNTPTTTWDKEFVKSTRFLGNNRYVSPYTESSGQVSIDTLAENAAMDNVDMNPLEFLALQFPGFAAESLAEVYFASGCDLNLSIEMLTQLELQVDGAFDQHTNSKAFSSPKLTAMDFPVLSAPDNQFGLQKYANDDLQQNGKDNMRMLKTSSSLPSVGAIDFASTIRKMASQDSSVRKYDKNGSNDYSSGSSRSCDVLSGPHTRKYGRRIHDDRLQTRSLFRAAPVWLETGEAVENLYSELREEDHAHLRNTYLEQAHQAYLFGNKAMAKELSLKGQLHNMQMKAAHGKAQESIYRQRNPVGHAMQGNGRAQERMIDLHGLHVSEALHVLKHELSVLRSTARAAEQPLQVYICFGTGHHTRGLRTPARLPVAVQHYLLKDEGLDYSEPQPGLLRVVIY